MENEGISVIHVDLPEHEEIELFPISDLHWSDLRTDEKKFKAFVDFIMEKPNRYVALNGDMLDMALTMSVSDTYGQKYSPSDSIDNLVEVLNPMRRRILAVGTGNHEDRVYKYTGIDVSRYFVREMGLGIDSYSDSSYVLFISFGKSENWSQKRPKKNVYSIFFHHGVGGGRMKGGKINMVERMGEIVNCDVTVVGHVHDPILTASRSFEVDHQNKVIKPRDRYYMISNAWQSYGGYGQKFGFKPSSKDINYMILNGMGRKKVRLCLNV